MVEAETGLARIGNRLPELKGRFGYEQTGFFHSLLLRYRYAVPLHEYEPVAHWMAQALNAQMADIWPPRAPDPAVEADVAALRANGFVRLGRLLGEDDLAAINAHFAACTVTSEWGGQGTAFRPTEPPADARFGAHLRSDIMAAPGLVALANDPRIIQRVAGWLGVPPTVMAADSWWSYSGPAEPKDAQLFHIDRHCYRFIKVFFFLTDVTMETGPHVYVRGSHRVREHFLRLRRMQADKDPQAARFGALWGTQRKADADVEAFYGAENVEYITGKAGEVFLINTAGIHKGLLPRQGRRHIAQFLYTMLPTVKDAYAPEPVPGLYDEIERRFPGAWTPEQHYYMNRMVVRF